MTEEELKREIIEHEAKIIILKEQLRLTKSHNNKEVEKFIGKYFIQYMFESGTRYLYVSDACKNGDNLELCGYGAVWYDQQSKLKIIEEDNSQWFENCYYGNLKEYSKEEFFNTLKDDINLHINELIENV